MSESEQLHKAEWGDATVGGFTHALLVHHAKVVFLQFSNIILIAAVQQVDTGHVSADRLHLKEKEGNYSFNKTTTCAERSGFCAWLKANWIKCSWSNDTACEPVEGLLGFQNDSFSSSQAEAV